MTDIPDRPILIVDDEPEILMAVDTTLRMEGMTNIITIEDSRNVIHQMEQTVPSLVILDLNMPHIPGSRLLQIIRKTYPRVPVIILTGAIDVETAVSCMKTGAMDYVVKPVEPERLIAAVKHCLAIRGPGANQENSDNGDGLLSRIRHPEAFAAIITRDVKMHSVFHYVEAVAPSSQPVLIFGETGVGKELIGQAIHHLSQRKGRLVVVNVAGLDDNVFSDTLFGHVQGAFTGADKPRQGLIELAAAGTLFLDEIGDLALSSQVKLLRLLQDGDYLPLGSDRIRHSDARVIASTNQDLWDLERRGAFRRDLIYRLSTHTLTLPPLRERLGDLPLLVEAFVHQAAQDLGKPVPEISDTLIDAMKGHPFKGNIRELKSMVHDAVSRHRTGPVKPGLFRDLADQEDKSAGSGIPGSLPTLKEASRDLVERAMKQTGGNQSEAARILGISQQALSKRLKKLRQEEDDS